MRTFLLLALLVSANCFAQVDAGNGSDGPCTGTSILTAMNSGTPPSEFNCTTLHITAGTYAFPHNDPTIPLTIPFVRVKVQGTVTIDSGVYLDLSGNHGDPDTIGSAIGGTGGPGADDGGASNTGPEDGQGPTPGLAGQSSNVCGGGGGGAGFATVGTAGANCSSQSGGAGGAIFNLTSLTFRGGSGGGAGGSGDQAGVTEVATGGGGGGSIWISAGGNITIAGTIDVRGGAGSAGPTIADVGGTANHGGGGGGSGGAILIQTLGDLVQNATFLLDGGNGGSATGTGGNGGAGGKGKYILEDVDSTIQGSGTGAIGNTIAAIKGESFKSAITCGTVAKKNDSQMYQMIVGFVFVILIARIRGLFRGSV